MHTEFTAQLYSIGYASKPLSVFIDQLKAYGVTAVADIRSVPYSNYFQEYHREPFKQQLEACGIRYAYLGDELGPRSKNLQHYNEVRQVQFNRLMQAELFKTGLERVFAGLNKGFTIAMACAEKDPAICHRSLLVGWCLRHHYALDMPHILHQGELLRQSQLEHQLMASTGIVPDMLTSEAEAMQLAYQKQCKTYAYCMPEPKA